MKEYQPYSILVILIFFVNIWQKVVRYWSLFMVFNDIIIHGSHILALYLCKYLAIIL